MAVRRRELGGGGDLMQLTMVQWFLGAVVLTVLGISSSSFVHAADGDRVTITGIVQKQDLRRVPQVVVEVKNEEGGMVSSGISNDAGEFAIGVPIQGLYSVSAVQETFRSEYI